MRRMRWPSTSLTRKSPPHVERDGARRAQAGHEVLHKQHARDVVQALAVDGQARVAVVAEGALAVFERRGDGERLHLRARDQGLAHLGVGEVEDAVDELPLLLFEVAALVRDVDELSYLLLGVDRGV